MRIKTAVWLLIIVMMVFAGGCGGSGSGGGGDDGGDDAINTTAGSVFPTDLVVTPPYSASAAASVSASAGKILDDYETERTELRGMLEGTTVNECRFALQLFATQPVDPDCYGPSVDYQNWPGGGGNGTLPYGDVGLWSENEGNEACAAAKVNQLVDTVGALIDSAVSIFGSIACSLNVNGTPLPAIGGSVDLAAAFDAIIAQNNIAGLTVDSATLARAGNDADGNAVYDFAFMGTATDGINTRSIEIYLRHIPLDTANAAYKGKLSFSYGWTDEGGGEQADAGSVLYRKSAATALTYRVQTANFVGDPGVTPDPLDAATRDIDPTINGQTDSEHGWKNNFNYELAQLNPQTGAGEIAHAWIAGNNQGENTRVFNATVTVNNGTKSGCAYYGYGPAIGQGTLGVISGMICDWAGPGSTRTIQQLVQRQCVVQNNGTFSSDTTAGNELMMRYAPVTNCNYAGGTFEYQNDTGTLMTNDAPAGTAVFNNDLLDIAEMSFTLPTAPADVY